MSKPVRKDLKPLKFYQIAYFAIRDSFDFVLNATVGLLNSCFG